MAFRKCQLSPLLVLLVGIQISGCGPAGTTSPDSDVVSPIVAVRQHAESDQGVVFDAGIILCDAEQKVCFPAAPLAITRSDQVKSVTTSCYCVSGAVFDFKDARDQPAAGIMYTFHREEDLPAKAQRLEVHTTIQLNEGDPVTCVVKVVLAAVEQS